MAGLRSYIQSNKKVMNTKIVKENIHPYWGDETELIKDQTVVSNYSKDGFDIELKKEIGWFVDRPNDIMVYRTYVRIFKEGKMLKRRLWYIDNPNYNEFIDNFIKLAK